MRSRKVAAGATLPPARTPAMSSECACRSFAKQVIWLVGWRGSAPRLLLMTAGAFSGARFCQYKFRDEERSLRRGGRRIARD